MLWWREITGEIKLNILSLFDGMSCGRIAAQRAGLTVDKYYASEVDKYAIKVSQANWPDIIQLGDVTKWREWDIDWSSIDLLIGGSPCQGFSFAGKQLAFDDLRSKLFFVYVDILNHIRSVNPDVKFMLENVKMKKEYLAIISEQLGVEPVFINSALVSAQNRQRYYWANWGFGHPDDKLIFGVDYYKIGKSAAIDLNYRLSRAITMKRTTSKIGLAGYYGGNSNSQRVYHISCKLPCLLTNNTGGNNPLWLTLDNCLTAFAASVNFMEFLQTVPINYCKSVSRNQAARMLGNGWTVDVVAHIFKAMPASG